MSNEDIKEIIKTVIEDAIKPLQDDITSIKEKITTLESDMITIRNDIANQNYRVNMLAEKSDGPRSFLDALSPAAVTGAKVRYINPAYQE